MLDGNTLFIPYNGISFESISVIADQYTPVLTAMRNKSGGITACDGSCSMAVNANTKNPVAAYNFIKQVL